MSFHKLVSGVNDLRSWCINEDKLFILYEWDCEKNIDLDPSSIAVGSEKKVWWKCSQGHEWKAQINSRTRLNTGCPYCSGRRLIVGTNDLKTRFPEVAKEWHPTKNADLKPTDVMGSSNIKVWWLCSQKHSYEARIGNRTLLQRGCPYCSGKLLLQGYNDFETWCKQNGRQDLLEEWNCEKNHGLKPNEILYGGAGKKYWWKGSCGHEWDSVISSRVRERQGKTEIVKAAGCPYCSNPPKRVLVGFNDLETWCKNNQRTRLLNEWNYERNDFKPYEVTFGSGKIVWWKCNKNHEWRTTIHSRTSGTKTNCPICARTQTSFPEQALAYYLLKKYYQA